MYVIKTNGSAPLILHLIKKQKFTPFSHTRELRYKRYITDGIRAKFTMLEPNGLIDIQVCCEVYDLNMRYYNYLFVCMLQKEILFNFKIIELNWFAQVFLKLCAMHEVSCMN